jgi:nucleoside-diphosphate kinase
METEKTLVLIKPDAMAKGLAGHVISELNYLGLKLIAIKIVKVSHEQAETHYEMHKDKPFFQKLIKHLTGEFHNNEPVMALVYQGENAISKVRALAGLTNPDESDFKTLRRKYGGVHSITNCFENVIHASDSQESADKEIKLWFKKEEIIE